MQHAKESRNFWQKLGDASLVVVGSAIVIGVPLFLFAQCALEADNYQRQVSESPWLVYNGTPYVDVGGDGATIPPSITHDIEEEQRAEAAQRYCEANDHEGTVADCVTSVMEGTTELPPDDYPTQDDPRQDYPAYP